MDLESVRQALKTAQEQSQAEDRAWNSRLLNLTADLAAREKDLRAAKERDARAVEISSDLGAAKQELQAVKEQLVHERRERQVLEAELSQTAHQAAIDRADFSERLAALEAEKEKIAARDRKSRDELDRLRMVSE